MVELCETTERGGNNLDNMECGAGYNVVTLDVEHGEQQYTADIYEYRYIRSDDDNIESGDWYQYWEERLNNDIDGDY